MLIHQAGCAHEYLWSKRAFLSLPLLPSASPGRVPLFLPALSLSLYTRCLKTFALSLDRRWQEGNWAEGNGGSGGGGGGDGGGGCVFERRGAAELRNCELNANGRGELDCRNVQRGNNGAKRAFRFWRRVRRSFGLIKFLS